MFFATISLVLKMLFPINDEQQMKKLHASILTKQLVMEEMKECVDYFVIHDPIMKKDVILLQTRTEKQENTRMFFDAFDTKDALNDIEAKNFDKMRSESLTKLIVYSFLLVVLLAGVVVTFRFLENSALSLFPVFSLISATIVLILLILEVFRFNILTSDKMQGKEVELDFQLIAILRLQFENNNKQI